jgi:hypothetical protein
MKRLLAPLLVLTLTFEAAGVGGGVFFCRLLRQRLTICCCPDAEERSPGPVLAATGCCDVLEGSAPVTSECLPSRLVADVPERSTLAMDVELPAAPVDLAPDEPATHWGSASGPPRRIPVFLSLRQLLI